MMTVNLWEQLPPRVERPYNPDLPGPSLLLPQPDRRKVAPYLLSTALHLVLGVVLWVVTGVHSAMQQPPAKWTARATVIRLPQRVFLPSDVKGAGDAKRTLQQRASQLIKHLGAQQSPARKIPPDAPAQQAQFTLIQPQYPLTMAPPPDAPVVPSALVWNNPVPPPTPRRAIVPGPVRREAPVMELRAPAVEVRAGARIVDVPESIRLNAAVLPVSQLAPRPPEEKQPASASDEHPVALLSVSNSPASSDTIVVPPGNVIPSGAASQRSSRTGPSGESASGVGAGTSATVKNNIPGQPDARTQASTSVTAATRSTAPNESASTGRELVHPPNGRFDIVLIQSSPDEDSLPAGILTGKPIYTVYLRVGDSKQWIMHYSAANSSPIRRGGVVQLPDPRPLNAPYPQVTVRPEEPVTGPGPYVLVHGIVDEDGSLQNLQIIGSIGSSKSSLLNALSRWKFQPATRGEVPQRIEMVLAIPIHKASSDM